MSRVIEIIVVKNISLSYLLRVLRSLSDRIILLYLIQGKSCLKKDRQAKKTRQKKRKETKKERKQKNIEFFASSFGLRETRIACTRKQSSR